MVKKIGKKETPLGEKETPLDEKVTIVFNDFLALAALISSRGGRWRRGSIAGSQAGATGATWLGGGGMGTAFWQGRAGRAGGFFGWERAGRGGGGRGGTLTCPGYGPIRCGRFGVNNARVVKKVGEKETPLGEKETPLGEKVTPLGEKRQTWRKSEFCWRKKHTSFQADRSELRE